MKVFENTRIRIFSLVLAQAICAGLAYWLHPRLGGGAYLFFLFPIVLFGVIELNYEARRGRKAEEKVIKLMQSVERNHAGAEGEIEEKIKELNLEEARMAAAMESLPIGIIIFDKDLTVILKNDSAERVLGVQSKKITITEVIAKFERVFDLRAAFEACIKEGAVVVKSELKVDKQYMRVFLSPVRLLHDHNEILGCVLLIDDITEGKLVEYSKNAFLAITSHELRTPLTIIRGNAELMLRSLQQDSDMHRMLLSIQNNSIRLLRIVNDLLDFAAIEEKQIEVKKEKVQIVQLLNEILKEVETAAKNKKLSLEFENKAVPPTEVIADADRVKEVLINLLSNAIQYTDAGGIRVILEDHGRLAKISVIDTGIGISSEVQKVMFEKFQTVQDRFIKTKDYGSGMGLHIGKLLAESMGGRIQLEASVPGRGSTFCLYLPLYGK